LEHGFHQNQVFKIKYKIKEKNMAEKLIKWNGDILQWNGSMIRVLPVPGTPVSPWPTDGLIARYALQDSLQNSSDLDGLDLKLVAGSTTFSAGNNGNAIDLDGTNEWATDASAIFNSFGQSDWTICSWEKSTDSDDANQWWSMEVPPYTHPTSKLSHLQYNSTGSWLFGMMWWQNPGYSGAAEFFAQDPGTIWHHYALVNNATTDRCALWVDGVYLSDYDTSSVNQPNTFDKFGVGWGSDGTPAAGQCQFVYIYNRTLDSDEIDTLYAGGSGV
jgi:hypothetical protein